MSSAAPANAVTLSSLDDLWKLLLRDFKPFENYLYRGEAKDFGSVRPVLDREMPQSLSAAEALRLELGMVRRFRRRALPLLSKHEADLALSAPIDTLAVMRHYGAPTRLLDWSESPWIALYFACAEKGFWNETGRLFRISSKALHERLQQGPAGTHFNAYNELVWTPEDGHLPRIMTRAYIEGAPRFVRCVYFNDVQSSRMVAQQGAVTIANHLDMDHWAEVNRICPEGCTEYRIPASLKQEVLRLLSVAGLTPGTLFPDVHGAAESVLHDLRIHADLLKDETLRSALRTCPAVQTFHSSICGPGLA